MYTSYISGPILDVGGMGEFFERHIFWQKTFYLLATPKQLVFLTISNENISLKTQIGCNSCRPLQDIFNAHVTKCRCKYCSMCNGVQCLFSFFLKFYNFNKGIIRIYSICKKPKTNVFILHLLTFWKFFNLQQNNV